MLAQAEFIAATRPGFELDRLVNQVPGAAGRVHRMDIPALAISSSDIRAWVARGAPIQYLARRGRPLHPEARPLPRPTGYPRDSPGAPPRPLPQRGPTAPNLRSSPLPTSLDHALTAASAASSKQARDVLVLDVSEPLVISDYFVDLPGR